ncbi:hypothetical protein PC116_g34764 [Phytophthora cactorum]|uniref:Uncharacterized protein n=1 Tax=Phytophthora cactorum TaxID=29920 RepID=A0A8T0YG34_9STRA|nr:hypothetical protein PC112_g25899 [Phytophthora cactorum]KAG2759190.1 hypothetical protein PC111_g25390 [Phytophthora cactorum]KAG2850935.1 hypothetical protein PC114_g28894 [Phytophthora cactorum]KAG2851538.1 hypothetical protein PC115_g26027 [Phytophthora cactorum]KAG2946241.1 hypothetical protein PC119_g28569 [Phytophthora cactorum]
MHLKLFGSNLVRLALSTWAYPMEPSTRKWSILGFSLKAIWYGVMSGCVLFVDLLIR